MLTLEKHSITLCILLAMCGGFMDVYSFIVRGGVFANAQTGNILLLAVNLSHGKTHVLYHYLMPILAFVLGVCISNAIEVHFKFETSTSMNSSFFKIHWRQLALILESAVFLIVGLMSQKYNFIANPMISFACGMQLEIFRQFKGRNISTTMCVGNLRVASKNLYLYLQKRELSYLNTSIIYFTVIVSFVLGAIAGSFAIAYIGIKSIFICSAILSVCFVLDFFTKK